MDRKPQFAYPFIAAPDFLGYPSAIAMAKAHLEAVQRGMHLQGLGNRILKLFGGRPVNPVGVRVGGFYRAPTVKRPRSFWISFRRPYPKAEASFR